MDGDSRGVTRQVDLDDPGAPDVGAPATSVAVVIPIYTMDRWPLIERAVTSARAQELQPEMVVLVVDHNEDLYTRAIDRWAAQDDDAVVPVIVVAHDRADHPDADDPGLRGVHVRAHGTSRRFGAGSARNVGVREVKSDIIAFMDDDAWADPTWLLRLLEPYADPRVIAVGGTSLPYYETARPAWFPPNFDWVFGCSYSGLPATTAPLAHLIGANMSVRRAAFEELGGFTGSDFDDLNLCMRLGDRFGVGSVVYEPRSVVHHYVSKDRVAWRYFYRRCYFVNREKARVLSAIGGAANLRSERHFVLRSLRTETVTLVGRALRGNWAALRQLGAMLTGIAAAGVGYAHGLVRQVARRSA